LKKFASKALVLFLLMSICMTSVAEAAGRASLTIRSSEMEAIATGKGKIAIVFSIAGTGYMSELGAKSITIYEKSGTSWVYADSYSSRDEGMIGTDVAYFGNTITYSGTSGVEYKIAVTLYAKKANGISDSCSDTFYVTA